VDVQLLLRHPGHQIVESGSVISHPGWSAQPNSVGTAGQVGFTWMKAAHLQALGAAAAAVCDIDS